MGLSGFGYNGHVFWDTELWMYPPLLILQPEIARSLLDYRYERLDAAKQNAFAHGFEGAMYPWESAGDGSEDTPVWVLTGPFEHHITGCIGWAFWKYYQVTKDKKADPDWNHVADNIPILKLSNGVTSEHASYHGEEIKQADVNLLSYPLTLITDKDQIRKDLEYYEPRMSSEGPTMGAAILSILHNRLGNVQRAAEIFSESYKPNEVPPFGVISETRRGTNPYFATGAGGMLQAVLSGFGGLEITDDGIIQKKIAIPKGWKKLKIMGVGTDNKTYISSN